MRQMLSLAAFVVCLLIGDCLGENATKKPHIIFILVDDMGWNDVSFHGSSQIPTPNLDALAFSGLIMHSYYANPLCTPSRSALLTGKYPIHTGMQNYVVDLNLKYALPLSETIMPEYLKDLGYQNHLVGKWHLGHYSQAHTPTHRGFDSFYGYYAGRHDYYDQTVFNGEWRGYDMRRNMDVDWSAYGNYTTTLLSNEAEEVIQKHDPSKPLFLYMAHLAPHSGNSYQPLQAPAETVKLFSDIEDPKRRMYAAMMYEMDRSVGRLVAALKHKGMLEDSIIVFSGDNGGAISGMDGNAASNWPLRGGKNTSFEGGVRVVGIVWSPRIPEARRGTIVNGLTDITDWLPTFYEAAGGDVNDLMSIDGISQWKSLLTGSPSSRTQLVHNIDDVYNYSAVRRGPYKLLQGSTMDGRYDGWFGPSGRSDSRATEPFDLAAYEQKLMQSDVGESLTALGMRLNPNLLEVRSQLQIDCGTKPANVVPCKPSEAPCLFNVHIDPCEHNNLANLEPKLVQELLNLIQWYNSTAVSPLSIADSADPTADPKYWNCTVTYWTDLVFNSSSSDHNQCVPTIPASSSTANSSLLSVFVTIVLIMSHHLP